MKLYIGNKNYSSWSLRVWLAMKINGLSFTTDLRPFDVENDYIDFYEFSPHGKVPVLIHEGETIWESLAILEYLAEIYPEKHWWPNDPKAKIKARCLANEMHAGFMALRSTYPMNIRRKPATIKVDPSISHAVNKDLKRVKQIWTECLTTSKGPFLFGQFSIADAMYAPLVNRLQIYQLVDDPLIEQYCQAITTLPDWQAWAQASAAEKWVVDIDEV